MTDGAWFGDVADAYECSRPGYPDSVVDAICSYCRPHPPATAIDVGAGTGKLARALAIRGVDVVAVEPAPGMAAVAEDAPSTAGGAVRFEVDRFETWEPHGRTFDLLTCGQAWHWLDRSIALRKAASVLAPEGVIAAVWNVSNPGELAGGAELLRAYARVLRRHPDAMEALDGRLRSRKARPPVDAAIREDLRRSPLFEEVEVLALDWQRTYSTVEYLALLMTQREHATLAVDVRDELLESIGRAIERIGGMMPFGYRAVLVVARRAEAIQA